MVDQPPEWSFAAIPEATEVEIVECDGKLHIVLYTTARLQTLARLEIMAGFPEQLLKHYRAVYAAGSDIR